VADVPYAVLKDLACFKHEEGSPSFLDLMKVGVQNENLLLYGRYVKVSREVSQTPWIIEGKNLVTPNCFIISRAIPLSKISFLEICAPSLAQTM